MKPEQTAAVFESMGLSELASEAVTAADAAMRNSRAAVVQAVNAGRLLVAAKSKVEHGQWKQWLADNWQGDGRSYETAKQYMRLAKSNVDVLEADSIREALQMLAEAKNDTRVVFESNETDAKKVACYPFEPDASNKKGRHQEPNPAVNLTPADISVLERPVAKPAEKDSQSRPTTRKVTKGTKKKVDSGKPGDDAKSPPPVAPQTEDELFTTLENLGDSENSRKRLAKRARKLADKWDPPKTGKFPTVDEVREYAKERGWQGFDAEKFWNHYEMKGWKLKGGQVVSKWKNAAANAWDKGTGWCATVADARVYTSERTPMEFEVIQ